MEDQLGGRVAIVTGAFTGDRARNRGKADQPNCGSKAALLHLTRQMAFELAPKVRVNAVAAGLVRTRLAEALWKDQEDAVFAAIPLRRIGEPPDIASAVALLVGPGASWMTGETMVVDGGVLLRAGI